MKKYYLILATLFLTQLSFGQIVTIPDVNFKNALLAYSPAIDTNNDGNIDVSEAVAIGSLDVSSKNITSLEGIQSFVNITNLNCYNNQLLSLNLSGLTDLTVLSCGSNQLPSLNLSGLVKLTFLDCSSNKLPSIDVSGLLNLTELYCSNNLLSTLDLSGSLNLQKFYCFTNNLTSINVTGLVNLKDLSCGTNQLLSLNVSGLTNLQELSCAENQLSSLDASLLLNLQALDCGVNQIATLNVSGSVNLAYLYCGFNELTSLDLSGLTNLLFVDCNSNKLQSLNVNGLVNLTDLNCDLNQLTSLDVSGLTNLQTLSCGINQLPSLNASNLLNLQSLNCTLNLLTSIDVSGSNNLHTLNCSENQLPSLDVNGLVNLTDLNCGSNQLPSIDVSGLTNLEVLSCFQNLIPSLNLSALAKLKKLHCGGNQLPDLDVSGLANLTTLYCGGNQLSDLDVNDLVNLTSLYCDNNPLVHLFLKNGRQIYLSFSNISTLKYICADEMNINYYLNAATTLGYTNCYVNSYCSFTPGGEFYTIQGRATLDQDLNGCDSNDNTVPFLKYIITGGNQGGGYIAENTGNYNINFTSGAYTVTPQLENPAYFIISPQSIAVNFPTDLSPKLQDFCLTPNGVCNDLEVTLIPINLARPGFDAHYKLVYINKGNTTLSGDLTLNFQDDVMDFLSATLTVASQAPNTLTWNYANLKPFEKGEILITMKLNTPIDNTFPLIGGAVLAFIATINPLQGDCMASDNVFQLNQTVVNAYDPNDKTCLEGTKITPETVGNFVHYMIRFENTGTADAVNIVVKDKIDVTKFDISTLIPGNGSHNFVTNINQSNDVEFVFEGINLPFDDANNDGYLTFKIKTWPTLAIGSTFENGADIYFDYNAPIITNVASTTIEQSLGIVEKAVFISKLFPNPVDNDLNIRSEFNIKEVIIFDVQGRLVKKVVPLKALNDIHIEMIQLKSGTYFVKTVFTEGTDIQKIIKN